MWYQLISCWLVVMTFCTQANLFTYSMQPQQQQQQTGFTPVQSKLDQTDCGTSYENNQPITQWLSPQSLSIPIINLHFLGNVYIPCLNGNFRILSTIFFYTITAHATVQKSSIPSHYCRYITSKIIKLPIFELHCLSKKVPTFKLSVTLSNRNRFSKFLHCWKAYEICNKTHMTISISP